MLDRLRHSVKVWNRERLRIRKERRRTRYEFGFGVLGLMKNEAMNIDEWITHYLSMGAGKIFLIDNGSNDDTVAKAKVWVAKGLVELVEYPARHKQTKHYWSAFKEMKIGQKCEWLLVADLDEFWFCPSGDTIAKSLDRFEGIDVVYANWRMFGSNGLEKHPTSIRQAFTTCAPDLGSHSNRKYMCRTAVVKGKRTLRIHSVYGAKSSATVSDNATFHLNHYPIQSLEFFQNVKMTRGDVATARSENIRDMAYFRRFDAPCTSRDDLLANFVASGQVH